MRPADTDDTIEVEVVQLGAAIITVVLPEGSTVADALAAAGKDRNLAVKIAGEEVENDGVLEDEDRLIIANKVKGGV